MAEDNRDVEMCLTHCDQKMQENTVKGNMEFHEILEDDFRVLKFDFDKTSTPAFPRTQSLKNVHFGQSLFTKHGSHGSTPFLNTCEQLRHTSCTKQGQLFSSSPHTESAFEELSSCKLEFASSDTETCHSVHSDMPTHCSSLESLCLGQKPPLSNHHDVSTTGYHSSGYYSLVQSDGSTGFLSMCSPVQVQSSFPNILSNVPVTHSTTNTLVHVKNFESSLQLSKNAKPNDIHTFPVPMEVSVDTADDLSGEDSGHCSVENQNSHTNQSTPGHANTNVKLKSEDTENVPSLNTDTHDTQRPNSIANAQHEHKTVSHLPHLLKDIKQIELQTNHFSNNNNSTDNCLPCPKSQSLVLSRTVTSNLSTSPPLFSIPTPTAQPDTHCVNLFGAGAQPKCYVPPLPAQVITPLQQERFKSVLAQHSPAVPDRLIGRRMGLPALDIMAELSNLSLSPVISLILTMLSDTDLLSVIKVSSIWNKMVKADTYSNRRVKQLLISNARLRELLQKENKVDKDSKRGTRNLTESGLPFGTLQYKQGIAAHDPIGLISPTKNVHQRYWKAASKLKNYESLRKCPRCQQPAKHHKEMEQATCCNPQCQYVFCTNCFNPFHGSSACSATLGKRNKLSTPIGSLKSKKNLKRLL